MTEDEAKTKWCPFVRFHIEGRAPTFTVAPNREQRGTKCIASACMAWRQAEPSDEAREIIAAHHRAGGSAEYVPNGYCGLAGTPA